MSIKVLFFLLIFFIFTSCIEEFTPKLENYDNIVVVDGRISNLPGPYTIKLNYSSKINKGQSIPISDASVVIVEKKGSSEILTEVEPGVYKSTKWGFKGKVGREYKLLLTLPNNKKYETDYIELKKPVKISSVKSSLESKVLEEENIEVIGYQFYVDADNYFEEKKYFLWFFNGVYKFETELTISDIYNGKFYIPKHPDTLKTCYINNDINLFYTGSIDKLSLLKEETILYIPAIDDRLKIRYSLLVNQYTVDKNAFEFWSSLQKITALGGSLYSYQPYQLEGNIHSSNNDEPVLGYFLVASIDSKRIFVDKPNGYVIHESCQPDSERVYGFIANSSQSDWPIYLAQKPGEKKGIVTGSCIDCTSIKGSNLLKPYFWVD